MNDNIKPSVDPWELLVDHNQRIQLLEQQVMLLHKSQKELAQALLQQQELYDLNKRTIDRVLDNQQKSAGLIADILNRSTPFSTGNH